MVEKRIKMHDFDRKVKFKDRKIKFLDRKVNFLTKKLRIRDLTEKLSFWTKQ